MKVIVDPKLCIGCGACVVIANDVFDLDQQKGVAVVVKQPTDNNNTINDAVESCPVSAIKISEEESK